MQLCPFRGANYDGMKRFRINRITTLRKIKRITFTCTSAHGVQRAVNHFGDKGETRHFVRYRVLMYLLTFTCSPASLGGVDWGASREICWLWAACWASIWNMNGFILAIISICFFIIAEWNSRLPVDTSSSDDGGEC